jgi:hypothetical protein
MLKLITDKQTELIDYMNKHNFNKSIDLEPDIKKNIANKSFLNTEHNSEYYDYFIKTNKFKFYQAKFELENYEPTHKINDFNSLIIHFRNILKHYSPILAYDNNNQTFHSKFEDLNWTEFNKDNSKYEIFDNEFIFENSISYSNKDNDDVIFFLKNIKRIFKLSTDLTVRLRLVPDDKYNIIWIIFFIKA